MEKNRATETILTISIGFLGIYLFFLIVKEISHLWMLYISFSIGILGLFWKWLRINIHVFWFWLADKLGFVMSRLILSIIFIFFLIPIGLIARIFRKDMMYMKGHRQSYYKERKHKYTLEDIINPW